MEEKGRNEAMSRSRFPDGFRILKGKQEFVTYIEHSSVRVWYSDTPQAYDAHYHSAVEIIMPIQGEVEYTVMDFSYRVQAGEVLIVPPTWQHSLNMNEGSSRFLILFEPDNLFSMRDMQLVEALLKLPMYLSEEDEAREGVRELLMKVVECYNKRDFLWNSMCYSYLLQMYVRLGQSNMDRELHRTGQRGLRTDSEIMDSARLYIDQNYMMDIDLSDASAFVGFSRCYFSRLFKRQTGTSFSEYLRQKRVSMAEELLVHTRQPVQDIALNVGFGSIATFNRVFRSMKSCTPSQYREIYGDFIK